jgi:phosphatidylserine decarboxylase
MISVLWGCINFISFGLSRSEINHTTYRTQVELVCPDLRSTTRPIVYRSSWFVPIWDQPNDLPYPCRVGLSRSEINHMTYRTQVELVLSRSEINHTTYRTQVELVCPDLRSTTRPIVPKSSWFVPIWDQPHDLSYPSRVGFVPIWDRHGVIVICNRNRL